MATIPLPQLKEGEEDIYSFGFDKLLYRDPPNQDEFLAGGDLYSQFGVYDSGVIGGNVEHIKFTDIQNTFVGVSAGINNAGRLNTGIGYNSLSKNTTGIYNTGLGNSSLCDNTTGGYNTAIGDLALSNNTTGSENTAVGRDSLRSNTTYSGSTAIGCRSLMTNANGFYNTAVGCNSLRSNTSGGYNTAMGYNSLRDNNIGYQNVAVGFGSLRYTTGSSNTAVGYFSLYNNSTGENNTAIGFASLRGPSTTTGSGNIGVGTYAGYYETGSNAFYINNQDRTDTAGDKSKSILYGVMAADPANQKLTINALLNQSITKTPAAANATGTKGDICWDANYIYVAVDTDTWKRVGIATW